MPTARNAFGHRRRIGEQRGKPVEMGKALRRDPVMLRHMATKRIADLGSLAHQQVTPAKYHRRRLLFW